MKSARIPTLLSMLVIVLTISTRISAQEVSKAPMIDTVAQTVKTLPAQNGATLILTSVAEAVRAYDDCIDLPDCQQKLFVANQRINKLLDQIDLGNKALLSSQQETEAQKAIVAKADERIVGLLNIIKDFANVPVKERKAWWKKVLKKLEDIVDVATDIKTIQAVASIILLTKASER